MQWIKCKPNLKPYLLHVVSPYEITNLYITYFNKYLTSSQIWMLVQNLNKITLSVITNPNIMENIKEKNNSNHVHFKKKIVHVYVEW
jgi:hypothetical protein